MKATELKIGDWVSYKSKPAKICSIDMYAGCGVYVADDIPGSTDDSLDPLPLTTEILEKNGWKLIHGFYCSPNEEGAEINLVSQTGYAWKAYTNHYLLHSKINSVSDLQHLLFGLGLDSSLKV